MPSLLDFGKPTDLPELCEELKRRIAGRGFAEPRAYDKAAEQILVDHPGGKALVLPAGTIIEGDLDLDDEGLAASGIGTIAVLGDLVVTGRILNEATDGGPFLIVDGNASARQVVIGGSNVTVLGTLTSSDLVFCDYNHGRLVVAGNLAAPAIVINDADVEIAGSMPAVVIGDEHGNLREKLVPEVFADPDDPEDEWPDGALLRERLAAGLPVLR